MNGSAERLRSVVEARAASPEECAAVMDTTPPSFWDLMSHDEDLSLTVSLSELRRLSRHLAIDPVWLLTGQDAACEGHRIESEALRHLYRQHARDEAARSGIENTTGYSYLNEEGEWCEPGTWNVEQLRAFCDVMGIDWRRVLSSMLE